MEPKLDLREYFAKQPSKKQEVQLVMKQKVYSVDDVVRTLKTINFKTENLKSDPRNKDDKSYYPLEVMVKAIRYMHDDLDGETMDTMSILHLSREQLCKMLGIEESDIVAPSREVGESLKKEKTIKKTALVKVYDSKIRQTIVN